MHKIFTRFEQILMAMFVLLLPYTASAMTIEKTAIGPFPWQPGGTGSYQIVVTNTGGAIASGALVVHDSGNFPSPPLTVTGMTPPPNWTCSSGQCSYTGSYPIPSGASWTFIVNVAIDATYAGGIVQNCAELTLQQAGPPEQLGSGCATANISAPTNGTPCDDGNACTYSETYINGICSGGSPTICDDGNPSTTDSCNPNTGCIFSSSTVCATDADCVGPTLMQCQGGFCIPYIAPSQSASTSIISVKHKHSPSHFSTGRRGSFKIVVKNRGNKLGKGMLTVVDHMPAGLYVKTGSFRANSWHCKGGMISGSGQDVTCTYNRSLGKRSRATLNLNATVAPIDRFPADVNEVENCATASVQGAAGTIRKHAVINEDVKVEKRGMAMKACDTVKIRHVKSRGTFTLPIGIGIGVGGFGSGNQGKGAAGRGVR